MTLRRSKREHSPADSTNTTPQTPPAGSTRWVVWVLLAILLFALVTDLIFYTGFYASDDRQYIRGAWQLAESGRLSYITTGTVRMTFLVPLALVAKLTDHNLFLMAASFVLYHLLVIVGTYWAGRLIHAPYTGLLAAGLIAVCPLAVLFATMIVPEHLLAALSLLAAGCVLVARTRLIGDDPRARSAGALCCLAGFLFVLACGTKITAVVLAPVFAALILSSAPRAPLRLVLRAGLLFAIGAAVAGLLLWVVFYAATGLYSPVQDQRMAKMVSTAPERIAAKPYDSFRGRTSRLIGYATNKEYLGLPAVAVLLALVGYPLSRGRSWGLYLAFIWVCAYMTWGTFSLTRYMPPPVQIRYFIFALPLLMIIVAFVAVSAARALWRRLGVNRLARRALAGLAVLACCLIVAECYKSLNQLAGKRYFAREAYAMAYALDFAAYQGGRPVVLSRRLSGRMWPLVFMERSLTVILSKAETSPEDVTASLRTGVLYLDSEPEYGSDSGSFGRGSPLDREVQKAVAGRSEYLQVRTLGSFSQFKTRFAALRYAVGDSTDPRSARVQNRRVFVREVIAVEPGAEVIGSRTAGVAAAADPGRQASGAAP
jgi:hypothetical protein